MSKTTQIIERAAELLRQGWTQGALARDAGGDECWELSSSAVSWCAMGALHRAFAEVVNRAATMEDLNALVVPVVEHVQGRALVGPSKITDFNDYVCESVDEIIEVLQETVRTLKRIEAESSGLVVDGAYLGLFEYGEPQVFADGVLVSA